MGRGPEMAIPIGQTFRANGIEVVATIRQPEPDPNDHIIPGETAIHEAKHIVVGVRRGIGVRGATIVPNLSAGYLGATWLDSADGPAAMAASADGHGGVGHDEAVSNYLGNPHSHKATAKGIINNDRELIHKMAVELQVSGTMGKSDVNKVVDKVDKKEAPKAKVTVKTPWEKAASFDNVEVKNGIVVFDALNIDAEEHHHEHKDEHLHDVFFGKKNEFALAG